MCERLPSCSVLIYLIFIFNFQYKYTINFGLHFSSASRSIKSTILTIKIGRRLSSIVGSS